ncbi:hypothetical protein H1R20_g13346, partial [Candolleomyces eurysporus]
MSNRPINSAGRVENANFGDNFGIISQGAGSIDASAHWHRARIGQQTNFSGNQYQFFNVHSGEDLIHRLNPILDASHTRNRKRSPPDSECFPGTREEPIQEIIVWADGGEKRCGKSSISLEVAKLYAGAGRLLATYFFFRGAGDRSTMNRFAATLASQLVAAIPATAPLIEAAVRREPGIVTGDASLATQLDLLILSPFQAVIDQGVLGETLGKGPFLIIIDGLDECEDKQGVEELVDHMLDFFKEHPNIALRIFFASRVEQHIRERLETDGVLLGDLDSHSPRKDIEKFLQASFQTVAKRDRVIRAYVQARGSWPTKPDMDKLISHINGSFVLASTMFKYIVQPPTQEDPTTPMERLPLTLEMNGLDDLYAQTLARSEHLPHFRNIISTIALLNMPLPIVKIAELLGIEAFEAIRVLLNLQAIIHVPGSDEKGEVTLCHTSLRDFLTTESRSKTFFVPPLFHLHLSYYYFTSAIERSNEPLSRFNYRHFDTHWQSFMASETCDFIKEIEQLKACQPLFVDRLPYHAFLGSMLFDTLFLTESWPLNDASYLLTECTKQFTLAVECPDHLIQLWLEESLRYDADSDPRTVEFTEYTCEALEQDVQRASTAIRANFPNTPGHQASLSGMEKEFVVDNVRAVDPGLQFYHGANPSLQSFRSGIDVFNVRQLSHLEDMKVTE